jgi:hypothetical protein
VRAPKSIATMRNFRLVRLPAEPVATRAISILQVKTELWSGLFTAV